MRSLDRAARLLDEAHTALGEATDEMSDWAQYEGEGEGESDYGAMVGLFWLLTTMNEHVKETAQVWEGRESEG